MRFRKAFKQLEKHIRSSWDTDLQNGNPLQYACLENSMDGGTW